MRTLLYLLIIAAVSTPIAHAIVDPDPDGIGIYFDLTADTTEIAIGPSIPFYAYVILTNPSAADIMYYEFSRIISVPPGMEGLVFRLTDIWHGYNDILPVLPPDLGNNVMVGWGSPSPTGPTVKLVTWQFMLLAPLEMKFYLGPTTGEFGTNARLAYESSTGLVPMHVSTGDPALPVATVNGSGVIPVSDTSFGSLKALYR